MCCVVGYIGTSYCREFVIKGLERLEYRGYDSAGFACLEPENSQIRYAKACGHLELLRQEIQACPIDGYAGIGHTRWSTHGASTYENAHPHFDCKQRISVVHNGIIENHHALRQELLAAGHIFCSKTDTEVIAHLLESLLAVYAADLKRAAQELVTRLEGAYACVIMLSDCPDTLLLVRKRSPLCIGLGKGEMFIASDTLAFADKTSEVIFVPDESWALVTKSSIELFAFDGVQLPLTVQTMHIAYAALGKDGYEHYMLKEMYEQKNSIRGTVDYLESHGELLWQQVGIAQDQVQALTSINLIGAGTSWHAARIAQFFFESIAALPTRVLLASEFRYMPFFPDRKGWYVAISQSGETADTLEALRLVSSYELPTLALTNVASSTMVRESRGCLLTQAGTERAVASTKAFSTQIAALYWLAHCIAYAKGLIPVETFERAREDLLVAAEVLENSIELYKYAIIETLAPRYARKSRAIFLGRHISYPFAMEAALKLKEISYIFAQCYPAGELKHGPLALVDEHTPIFLFSHQDPLIYQKLVANAQEVKARAGHLVSFAFEGQDELCRLSDHTFVVPHVPPLLGPLAMTGVMQFFVYQLARELGCPIDKPRNLAKSVTVE